MSLNKFTIRSPDGGGQNSLPFAPGLVDSGTLTPDESLPMIVSFDSDELPEKFRSLSIPDAVVRSGETDNAFVREQPW